MERMKNESEIINNLSKTCIDRIFEKKSPGESSNLAKGVKLSEGPARLVVETDKMWEQGRVLKVRFLEGTEEQKNMVAKWVNEWSRYANLIFDFGSSRNNADILVKFQPWGNYSLVGTDSLRKDYRKDSGDCSLNIQEYDLKGTVLHEFGHSIGFVHEHSSPVAGIQWNKPVVYRDLGQPPNEWPPEVVDQQVFFKYSKDVTQYTAVDKQSVMMYAYPAAWTTNGFSTEFNNDLSATDKEFASAIYPGATALFLKSEIRTARCSVNTGPETMYNKVNGNSWIMHEGGKSFIEVNFNQAKKFGGKDIYETSILRIKHLTSATKYRPGKSPVNITLNGNIIKENYSPRSSRWMEDFFDITSFMEDGDNKIRIELQKGAQTNYWINYLKVRCSGGDKLRFGE